MEMRMQIPTLTTPRLLLRPFTLADLHPLFVILQEPDIFKYFPRTSPPPLEKVERIINEQLVQYGQYGFGQWAVELHEIPGLIGWCGLNHLPETDEDEVAYLLSQSVRGQGYATEGAKASLEFGFEKSGLKRIIALVHPENIASRRVAEKIGMTLLDHKVYWGMECLRFELFRS
jgi:ribosomal-protein-alanine N-acetyltransferase